MLEIITADEAGFCFGVKRAIDIVKAAIVGTDQEVYTLGPIIHNPQVVENLKGKGVNLVDSVDEIEEGILVIRTHGVEPSVLEKAEKKGLNIIDATCPFVKNAHIYAKELVKKNYQTFIFGDKNHPEVKGIFGHTNNNGIIIESPNDIKEIDLKNNVGLVAQTTQSYKEYLELIANILPKVKELSVYNTICNTTGNRQKEAKELAKKVDVMLVVGGHNSANTKRLAEISAETNTPTFHIETVDELNWDKIRSANKIGLTAGASTPDWIIKEVLEIMSEEKKDIEEMENEELEEVNELNENEEEAQEIVEEETEEGEEKAQEIGEEVREEEAQEAEEIVEEAIKEVEETEEIVEAETEEEEDEQQIAEEITEEVDEEVDEGEQEIVEEITEEEDEEVDEGEQEIVEEITEEEDE
ncbi:MAG: 4-hydroxy-3-methylbut-2-enyl diphosphate reductase, partial [Halanaerobiales bacterium]